MSCVMQRLLLASYLNIPHGTGDIFLRDMSGVFLHGTLAQGAFNQGGGGRGEAALRVSPILASMLGYAARCLFRSGLRLSSHMSWRWIFQGGREVEGGMADLGNKIYFSDSLVHPSLPRPGRQILPAHHGDHQKRGGAASTLAAGSQVLAGDIIGADIRGGPWIRCFSHGLDELASLLDPTCQPDRTRLLFYMSRLGRQGRNIERY